MAKFQVLYTKHKTQTRKTWQDGFIKLNALNRKVILTSEDENAVLDSLFLKQAFQLRDGSQFETEKFLVDVQEVDGFVATLNGAPQSPAPPKAAAVPASAVPHNGLKRKTPTSEPSTEPKKRRLGLNKAVMRAGTLTASAATEFKQPVRRVAESSASVSSESLDTVAAHEELSSCSVPSTQERKSVSAHSTQEFKSLSASVPSTQEFKPVSAPLRASVELDQRPFEDTVEFDDAALEPLPESPLQAERTSPVALQSYTRHSDTQNENSFDYSLSPSSPDIDFGFLIEPLHSSASTALATPLPAPRAPLTTSTDRAPSTRGNTNVRPLSSTALLQRRVGLGRASDKVPAAPLVSPAPKPVLAASPLPKTSLHSTENAPEFKSPKQALTFAKATRWSHASLCFPDKQTCADLHKSMPKPRHALLIPNSFADMQHYVAVFTEAIHELLEVAKRFHAASESVLSTKGYWSHDTEKKCRAKGVKLYANCELKKSDINPFIKHQKEPKSTATQLYLQLGPNSREHYSHYARDDIWIVSSNPSFAPRNADDVFFLARSVYHGPTSKGLLEIKPVAEMPRMGNKQLVHALHGPNFSLDMSMLENLLLLRESTLPLIPALLGHFQPSPRLRVNLPPSRIAELAQDAINAHGLNDDQQRVLQSCVRWFDDTHAQLKDEVVLVHGVYGSGKSHLLVVLIVFLCTMLKEARNEDIRILISAATNTAVDRILLGLLELDFTEFIRVGSLKRIAKPVLPFTLHRYRGDSKADNERSDKLALKELQDMLQSSGLSSKERSYVKQAIDDLKDGRVKQRIDKLKKVRVVAVTCAASVFPVLEGNKFQIVILDEASQMLEPLSMLPIGKFGCEKLISVGDPMQLPPKLSSNQISTAAADHTLGKTLFARLAHLGVAPIMLRTQYRLHPQLSKISNKLFYANQLRDGVTPEDRAPLVAGVPTLLFCNTANAGKEVYYGDSCYNQHEAQLVVELILMLLERGCRGEEIGVIALYKRQEEKISELLLQRTGAVPPVAHSPSQGTDEDAPSDSALSQVQVSTVDAFQGAEKEIIIVSTVRTAKLGFTDSPNRLNVALTRARRHLLIVGRASTLVDSHLWREVVTQARATKFGFQHAQSLLAHRSFTPSTVAAQDEPTSDTCHNEGDSDTRPAETEGEEEFDSARHELRGSRDSPEPLPGLAETEDISLLGSEELALELESEEMLDEGQLVFALDDEAAAEFSPSPSPSRSVAQSSELSADVPHEYQLDEQDEFDLGF